MRSRGGAEDMHKQNQKRRGLKEGMESGVGKILRIIPK